MATIVEPETTVEVDLDVLPDDALYEVIDGRVVEKVMGADSLEVASILHIHLGPFVSQADLGRTIVELVIRIDRKTQYRPDVSFISNERWPVQRKAPRKGAWDVIPDLAVEVISETDHARKVLGKTHHYFRAGVRAVWLIYPDLEIVHVYDAFDRIRVFTKADVIDGGEVIPGFRLPLANLFKGEAAEEGIPDTSC